MRYFFIEADREDRTWMQRLATFVPLDIDVVDLHVLRFQLIDDGTVEIVNEQDAELQEEGLDITEQILTANPDVQMIWCWNQVSLLGCAAGLENAQRSDIVLMGTDMSVELAKDMLGDSITLQAITTQMPYEMGYTAVENAVKAVKGTDVEKEIMIPTYTYTKENLDEIQTYIDEHQDLVD